MNPITLAIIGGSGLAATLGSGGTPHDTVTPFGPPASPIFETTWDGVRILLLSRHGNGHRFNPTQVPFRANIFALKQLGCTHIIASGAVGSLRQELSPRDLVICDQTIDKTHLRSNTFFDRAAVHVDFAEPFCNVLRQLLIDAASNLQDKPAYAVHRRGCYICMEGPAFSTRSESIMHRLWGGDVIGMTAMPEAKLAREAEISYATLAMVTDYDCWKPRTSEDRSSDQLLGEIIGNLKAASDNAMDLIRRAVRLIAQNPDRLANASAASALKLAIWSDKHAIAREEVERLGVLWGRYFE